MLLIEVSKNPLKHPASSFRWKATALALKDSPPPGFGRNKEEAVGSLILNISNTSAYGKSFSIKEVSP